uniref:Uncharacterized protein n=1 Tax=Anguilla anguilla TaxID=7936 RepID=A0A0E9PND3_ANGAN
MNLVNYLLVFQSTWKQPHGI